MNCKLVVVYSLELVFIRVSRNTVAFFIACNLRSAVDNRFVYEIFVPENSPQEYCRTRCKDAKVAIFAIFPLT